MNKAFENIIAKVEYSFVVSTIIYTTIYSYNRDAENDRINCN